MKGATMKRLGVVILGMVVLFWLTGCAAGPNPMLNTPMDDGKIAGFWQGLWHGMIAIIAFIVSLFNDSVTFYEVHNNGGWYNFGFLLGLGAFTGGGARASSGKKRA